MRKLKLQMQITVDGFVAGPDGQLDWMTWDNGSQLVAFINQLTDTSDTILLGRKMTPGFISHWEHALTEPGGPEYAFAQKMVGIQKVVFSRTLHHVDGQERPGAQRRHASRALRRSSAKQGRTSSSTGVRRSSHP